MELAQSTVDHPEIERVVPEYKRKDLRERIHKRYQVRIVYWLRFDTILVVAVYRCSQRKRCFESGVDRATDRLLIVAARH